MNISQPVGSTVESVEFTFLSAEEVKAISVKRIENENTFDTLLNPVPGGLYDLALGSWGDALCATCNLGQSLCPGHPGHIELPVPVYHPVFMDQVLRLLRASCVYCHRFRLRARDLNRYICKFRLLQYGLLAEAGYIDAIGERNLELAVDGVPQIDYEDDEVEDGALDGVCRARIAYVERTLEHLHIDFGEIRRGKHEGATEARRALIKDFMKDIVAGRLCVSCKGISPSYRKDRAVKIFQKNLAPKEQAKMAVGRFKMRDAMTVRQTAKSSKPDYQSDEGIADIDLPTEEEMEDDDIHGTDQEEEEEEEEDGPVDELDETGGLVKRVSISKAKPGRSKLPQQRYLSAQEVLERLRLLFARENEILRLIYNSKPPSKTPSRLTPDMFFIQTILIPPNRFRPEALTGTSQITEAEQNSLYKKILGACFKLAQIHREISGADTTAQSEENAGRSPRDITSLHEAWTELQNSVNSLIDRSKNPVQGQAGKRNEEGIKQKLEKKEGLFRKNMMGKRVNYAARSVISPDPNIETNEIGVPPVFARKLTYPEPVTSHNFKEMQQAVINGIEKWPGAAAIENENGQIINLRNKSPEERVSLANQLLAPTNSNISDTRNKKVHRHLSNGDVVLMNRQPTLHKPSIMGHRVRVLPGEKTIRMHYANCNTYNADFDGDEMNMHFPQNEIARAEALQLADTDHQYISGTQGKPLRGLIQDHLSVSVALCNKDTLFDRAAYQQLIYSAVRPENGHIFSDRIELVPPAILKPVVRWTGKQVISTVLKNIKPPNCGDLWMSGKSQIPADRWGSHVEEGVVEFRDGELISGILDKSQLGSSSGGLIHSVHEVYGPAIAGKLLSSMGRLLTKLLHMRAFTCGIDDLRLTRVGETNRRSELAAAAGVGLKVAASYVSLGDRSPDSKDSELLGRLADVMRDDTKQEGLDLLMNEGCGALSTKVTMACLPSGLEKQFPRNQMQTMTISGAKGGLVNANLISCNLGQQILEGRRVPLMVSGKSLPCYEAFDTDIRAGGYVVSRFLTGIRPQEYYFHHMAGREGLIDTAVKTSRSGYLQRCLIKGLEGLEVSYDSSVRDADGTLVQFLYGEDGLDVTKQKYLSDFRFLLQNLDSQLNCVNFGDPGTDALFAQRDAIFKRTKRVIKRAKANFACPDEPTNALSNPYRNAFNTSEKFFEAMNDYIQKNKDNLIKDKSAKEASDHRSRAGQEPRIGKKGAEKIFAAKHLRSLVEPGEAVGIVAGQSVGEPSTQMTLNTFHLAGHSSGNVTLGIPRLREILMTASAKISTPTMRLILNPELSRQDGERFAKAISVLSVSHVLDKITIRERVGKGISYSPAKTYDVQLRFFPAAEYMAIYAIAIADVLDAVERKVLPMLRRIVDKEIKQRRNIEKSTLVPDIAAKAGAVETAAANPDGEGGGQAQDDDDSDEDGDDDATNAKQRANRSEAVSYGPNDDEDDAIQARLAHEDASDDDDDGDDVDDEGYGGSPPPPASKAELDDPESPAALHEALAKTREARVKNKNRDVSQFRCDEIGGEWCLFTLEFAANTPKMLMLNMVQEAVHKSVIQQVEGVGTCKYAAGQQVTDRRTGEVAEVAVVNTEGANIRAMQSYGDYLDPNRILTNDIVAVLDVYGVEACRNNIIRELSNVFTIHGIAVDNRHLNLIGDYMTRNGGFTPFNRMGMKGNVSPFTKMSFETTLMFLKDALLDGDWDSLVTPTGRLVTGKLGRFGTGAFDVLTRVPMEHYDGMQNE